MAYVASAFAGAADVAYAARGDDYGVRGARRGAVRYGAENDRRTDMYGLKTESSFDAAHFLTDYHGKCENLHGHRWRVVAYLAQDELSKSGTTKDMVVDFGEFKQALRELTEELDHSFVVEEGSLRPETIACLEAEGFELSVVPFRTTAENLARYFYERLAARGLCVARVDVYETPNNCALYCNDDADCES